MDDLGVLIEGLGSDFKQINYVHKGNFKLIKEYGII